MSGDRNLLLKSMVGTHTINQLRCFQFLIKDMVWVPTIDFKRRLRSPDILFYHHGASFWGKSTMFACSEIHGNNNEKGVVRGLYRVSLHAWHDVFLLLACGRNGSVEMPVTAQLTHTLLFFHFRTGHRNCWFTPKVFPMVVK